jgi:hypothetical protein
MERERLSVGGGKFTPTVRKQGEGRALGWLIERPDRGQKLGVPRIFLGHPLPGPFISELKAGEVALSPLFYAIALIGTKKRTEQGRTLRFRPQTVPKPSTSRQSIQFFTLLEGDTRKNGQSRQGLELRKSAFS